MNARVSALVADSLEVNADAADNDDDYDAARDLMKAARVLGVSGVLRALSEAAIGVVDMTDEQGPPFELAAAEVAELRALSTDLGAIAKRLDA